MKIISLSSILLLTVITYTGVQAQKPFLFPGTPTRVQAGKTTTLRWSAVNTSNTATFDIDLLTGDGLVFIDTTHPVLSIVKSLPLNTGNTSYNWRVPLNISSDRNYTVQYTGYTSARVKLSSTPIWTSWFIIANGTGVSTNTTHNDTLSITDKNMTQSNNKKNNNDTVGIAKNTTTFPAPPKSGSSTITITYITSYLSLFVYLTIFFII